jgi:hypothetical protein
MKKIDRDSKESLSIFVMKINFPKGVMVRKEECYMFLRCSIKGKMYFLSV